MFTIAVRVGCGVVPAPEGGTRQSHTNGAQYKIFDPSPQCPKNAPRPISHEACVLLPTLVVVVLHIAAHVVVVQVVF